MAMRIAALCLLLVASQAFYLPGLAPRNYEEGEEVDIKVNKLDSVRTQLPYDYYSLPFCQPDIIEEAAENLGEVLSGDRIETSKYEVRMNIIEACKILCRAEYSGEQLHQFADRIGDEYRVNMMLDNLPAATKIYMEMPSGAADEEPRFGYEKGFALGFTGSDEIPNTRPGVRYLNNHIRFNIFFHREPNSFEGYRVVGFEVEPFSVKHQLDGPWRGDETRLKTCTPLLKVTSGMTPQPVSGLKLTTGATEEVIWTYDVQWEESDIKWVSRWDTYLRMADGQIHWFSIINSIVIVLMLTGMVAVIMARILNNDLRRYNEIDLDNPEDGGQDETGWKMIHGEVFRRPEHPGLFSIFVGTGAQVFLMTLATLVFAVLGFLSPAHRGGLATALLLLFTFCGVAAGYVSTRLFKMFKLTDWQRNAMGTALLFPGLIFTIFFLVNTVEWSQESSSAVPFGSLVVLVVLWLGISSPLVGLGAYLAFRKPAIEPPVKVNNIPRMLLPERAWYTNPQLSILVGGVLPFGAVFIEIFFIMSSVWLHQFYYMFGFLFIVFCILIITCAEITIVMCYFQLCNEDYHWWWRSYLTSGSSALYLFLYSIVYFFTKLEIVKFASAMVFFGYMLLVSAAFFVLTGTIGWTACYLFVRKIYSSIKID